MIDFLLLMSGKVYDVFLDDVAETLVCTPDKLIIPISVTCSHETGTETNCKAFIDDKATIPFWRLAVASGSATAQYNMLLYFASTVLKDKNELRVSFAVSAPPNWVNIRYLEVDTAVYNDLLRDLLSKAGPKRGFWRFMK